MSNERKSMEHVANGASVSPVEFLWVGYPLADGYNLPPHQIEGMAMSVLKLVQGLSPFPGPIERQTTLM